jgi:hypothetical protein
MRRKLTDKRRKILRKIYGALSFTTALFVFQACYGSPSDFGYDAYIQGIVKSTTTNQPIRGIKVIASNGAQFEFTDSKGEYKMFVPLYSQYYISFLDTDSGINGSFMQKDTIFLFPDQSVRLNVYLDDK